MNTNRLESSPELRGAEFCSTKRVDYLVGGFRVSIKPDSNTPGPRTHILGFTGALKRLGLEPAVFLASNVPFMSRFSRIKQSDYINSNQAKVWLADLIRIVSSLWTGVNLSLRTLRAPKPDFIYERTAVLQSLTSFHMRKKGVVRVVEANGIMSRETARDRKILKSERLAAYIERRVLRRADLVVAVSSPLADELVKFASIHPEKILVVPNGIDPSVAEVPISRDPSAITIGFCGSVVAWQRVDRLIRCVKEASEAIPPHSLALKMEIVGEGPEIPRLVELVGELGMSDSVIFRGRLPHSDALEAMSAWDIGIAGHAKSTSEAMYHSPLKLYEYAALGMGIICTDSGDAQNLRRTGISVQVYETDQELVSSLVKSAEDLQRNMDEIDTLRRAVTAEHGWDSRAGAVLRAVVERARTLA